MIYNTSNLTGNNIYEIGLGIVQLEPFFGVILLSMIFFISLIGLMTRFDFQSSLLTASFLVTVFALFLRPIDFITTQVLVAVIVITALIAALVSWRG